MYVNGSMVYRKGVNIIETLQIVQTAAFNHDQTYVHTM